MKKENNICPVCGSKGILKQEIKTEEFRKEKFENIVEFYYYCEKCGEDFIPSEMMDLNLVQVYNQYRERHNILFPDEIKKLREDYELSTVKMSRIMGFGENVYRNYEAGEVPSLSNATSLTLANDPFVFEKMVKDKKKSYSDILSNLEYEMLLKKIQIKKEYLIGKKDLIGFINENMGRPSSYSGYKLFDFIKYEYIVIFFLEYYGDSFKTYINKFLFYSDFLNYKNTGYSISGAEYVALPKGPCPDRYDLFYEIMMEKEVINVEEIPTDNGVFEKFKHNINFNKELFNLIELESLRYTLEFFKTISPIRNIVNLSHKEKAWIENEESKGKIDYQKYAFGIGM